jgi:hypothetical protein
VALANRKYGSIIISAIIGFGAAYHHNVLLSKGQAIWGFLWVYLLARLSIARDSFLGSQVEMAIA